MRASLRSGYDVPRYFLSLRYRDAVDGLAVDEEGNELPGPGASEKHVETIARERIAGSFVSCDGALTWAEHETPDVALLDFKLKDGPCTDSNTMGLPDSFSDHFPAPGWT